MGNRTRIFLEIILIITLGFVVYSNSLNGRFVWDDYGLVKENNYIKSWSNLPKVITGSFGAGGGSGSNFYRPLQMLAHMAGYSLWGLDVRGYHLTSILLHILAAVAFYFFINILFSDRSLSFAASLFFIAHPINTEAVCYISGVSDPLSLLFMLLCLICYIKSRDLNNAALYILALLSFIFALLSKENAVILPLLVLLYHYAFRKSPEIKKLLPFFVILASYFILRSTLLSPFVHPQITFAGLLKRIPGFFAAITGYVRLLLLPFSLHIEYGDRLFKVTDPRAISGLLISLLLIATAFFKRKNNPFIFFSIAWFFIALLPVSNIYSINSSFMMEHWLYVPSLGFFLVLARWVTYPLKNKILAGLLKAFAATLLVFYSYLTIKQTEYWREPIAFCKRSLKYAPASWRFYNELGLEYANAARYEEAIAAYTKALEINPNLTGVYYNVAGAYQKVGRDKEALSMYNKAKDINSKFAREYYETGNAYMDSGKEKEAIASYRKALEIYPHNLELCNALASAYIIAGNYKEAIVLLKRALEIDNNSSLTHNNLAVAYYYTGKYDLAIQHCDKAIRLGYKVKPEFLSRLKPYHR
jgi:Flp pilus assembly protein TadD